MPEERDIGIIVDPFDMSIGTEQFGDEFNPEVDSGATIAPPSDGLHLAKLQNAQSSSGTRPWVKKFIGADTKLAGEATEGKISERDALDAGLKLHFATGVQVSSLEDGSNWRLYDYMVSTRPGRGGGCRAADIIRAATGMPATSRDSRALMQECQKVLSAEMEVAVETRWEASCMNPACNDTRNGRSFGHVIKSGQKKFQPIKGSAKANSTAIVYNHEIECDKCGVRSSAQARIQRYLPASEYHKAHKTGVGGASQAATSHSQPASIDEISFV